jgi:RimJ/RimL family protein N-acetyltransferase
VAKQASDRGILGPVPDRPHQDFARIRSPFEGELVRLRAIEESDLPLINEGIWNPEVSRFLSMAWPQPVALTREWWEHRRKADGVAFVIETLAGEFVGGVSLEEVTYRSRVAVLGIWIGEPHWSRGYGTDAVRRICRFGFNEMNLQRVALAVYDNNPRGRRAYEKVGFKEEGRLRRAHFIDGDYVDVIIMGLLAEELLEP